MRILIVSCYSLPHVGGIQTLVDQEVRALAAEGHTVSIVTSDARTLSSAPEYPAETQTDKSIDWNARIEWIEARLLEGLQPDQPTLDALARERAQAVQSTVLANTAVAPERLFITTERSASLADDGRVRMELKLE